jgi:Tfp pilus assembly protein PilO
MSMTDRDRKILMALIPLAVILGYWFLLLSPKRQEASTIQDKLATAETVRDTAQQKASSLAGAKRTFAADYATVIRLGKSIPASVDMPSLLVQLDRAATGTGIKFTNIRAGERSAVAAAAPATSTPAGGGTGPTAAGAAPAQSGAGQAAQNTAGAVNNANAGNAAAAGAATGTPTGTGTAATSTTLETVPLDFEFRGSFFDLADFFHRMKRFVRVTNNKIVIRGRLMTINSFAFDSSQNFPQITATVSATVYLAPKAQGVSAGASPQGPVATGGAAPQPSSTPTPAPAATPTATVTTR